VRSRVVFPEPLEPMSACVAPLGTVRLTSVSTNLPSKVFVMFCNASMEGVLRVSGSTTCLSGRGYPGDTTPATRRQCGARAWHGGGPPFPDAGGRESDNYPPRFPGLENRASAMSLARGPPRGSPADPTRT